MKYEVENYAQQIRDYIEFKYGQNIDEEKISLLFNDLDIIKNKNFKLYKTLIGVFFTDFYILNYVDPISEEEKQEEEIFYDIEDFKHFTCIDDVLNYIEEEPEFLGDIIYDSFSFNQLPSFDKRCFLLKSEDKDNYLAKICPSHFLDKLDYCQEYNKDELILKYKEFILSNEKCCETREELEIYARDYITDFLWELDMFDSNNYEKIVLDIVKDYYIYQKYESINHNLNSFDNKLMNSIENNSLNRIINLSRDDDNFLSDLFQPFVEFNDKDPLYQENAIITVDEKADDKVKQKILKRPIS